MIRSLIQKGFFHLLSVNFLTQLLGFGTILLVAKFLTPIELGEARILQSYAAVFAVLAAFGFNTAILKFCAEDRPSEDRDTMLRRATIRSGVSTAATVTLLVILSVTGVVTTSSDLARWMIVYALVVPLTVGTNLLVAFLQAVKRIRDMSRAQAIIRVQTFVLIVACTWLWGFPGFVLATVAAYALGVVPLLHQVGTGFLRGGTGSGELPGRFSNVAIFSVLASSVSVIGQYADLMILDHFAADRTGIGYYSLATVFILGAMQVTGTVQQIATPYFSERATDERWFRRALVTTQLKMAGLSLAVAVAVYALAVTLIGVFYGPEYEPTLAFLRVLLLRYILWSSYAIMGVAILGLGLVRLNFYVVAITTPLGIALALVLLRFHDIVGVAWAQTAVAATNLVLVLLFMRHAMRTTFAKTTQTEQVSTSQDSPTQ